MRSLTAAARARDSIGRPAGVFAGSAMFLKAWRFLTLTLALALTMTSAHVLELTPKMQYDADLYATVNATLYRNFATIGAVYTLGSIVAAAVLTALVRGRRPAFGWTLAGAICLVLAIASWLALVAPVNRTVAAAQRAEPGSVPALWAQLRSRWEYGHATGFVIQLGGFCALLASILVETPEAARERLRRAAPRLSATDEWGEASRQGGLIP